MNAVGLLSAALLACVVGCSSGPAAHAGSVRVVEGPIVLHGNIRQQWGGHTFGYLLEGKQGVFWSAAAYDPSETLGQTHLIVGQYPKPGSKLRPATTAIAIPSAPYPSAQLSGADAGWRVYNCNQPQMLRTPDGYIHLFFGAGYLTGDDSFKPGRLRYYRSAKPEDISTLVDCTPLIPTTHYDCFHLRMNVGISPDGKRMALVVLAFSRENKFGFNTPVVFVGKRVGLDFKFADPVSYAEPMGFFYPQVAATDAGIVLVGQEWGNHDRCFPRLMHIGWDGTMLHREDLPMEVDGSYMPVDMRPRGKDFNRLLIYCSRNPKDKTGCSHDVWQYEVQTRRLHRLNSVACDYSQSNGAKLVVTPSGQCLLINDPSMGPLYSWEGDVLGGGSVSQAAIPGGDPLKMGYKAMAYMFVPNMLYGSVPTGDEFYLASDCANADWENGKPGPFSFLLWRMTCSDASRKP